MLTEDTNQTLVGRHWSGADTFALTGPIDGQQDRHRAADHQRRAERLIREPPDPRTRTAYIQWRIHRSHAHNTHAGTPVHAGRPPTPVPSWELDRNSVEQFKKRSKLNIVASRACPNRSETGPVTETSAAVLSLRATP